MGWFWAETSSSQGLPAHHPHIDLSSGSPPPSCPMHQKSATAITPAPRAPSESACPYTPPDSKLPEQAAAQLTSTRSKYNPLNYMFSDLSQEKAANQKFKLDIEREPSSIPRGEGTGNWEYPSPQQMYNALLRKGYTDTDIEAVPAMVSVHNFLNEGAWREIQVHEGIFAKGLAEGWKTCSKGEEGIEKAAQRDGLTERADPKLMRFQGRPKDMTPKALMWQVASWAWPAKFETAPPFDRHDWYVERRDPYGPGSSQIRYVIDYYAAPDDEDGNPVFNLDVRPAIDKPSLALERAIRWGGDVWWRAKGGDVSGTEEWSFRRKVTEK